MIADKETIGLSRVHMLLNTLTRTQSVYRAWCIQYIDRPLGEWTLSNMQYMFLFHQREAVSYSCFNT